MFSLHALPILVADMHDVLRHPYLEISLPVITIPSLSTSINCEARNCGPHITLP